MNSLKLILQGVIPLFLVVVIVSQVRQIPEELKQPIPAHKLSYETLKKAVEQVELAAKISFDDIDTTFSKPSSTPFGKTYQRRIRKKSGPKFVRTPLSVQGILQGAAPLVVLQDPTGKTHIVKRGEIVFERKVIKIGSKGVTLRDKAGTEILMVE